MAFIFAVISAFENKDIKVAFILPFLFILVHLSYGIGIFYGLFWRQGRELFVQYKSVTSVIGCHHICKQDYTTSPCEAEPKCEKGGYVVVDNKTCGYECSPVDCGTRENIDIKIRVYDSENNTVFIDYADTDAKGNFDYTFSVPKKDGRYTAAVSVPEY